MSTDTPRQVQLRQDLQQSQQQHQGKSYLVVKDPIARRYFRFTETQAQILALISLPIDAEAVAAQASEKLGGNVSPASISAFFDSLESKDLLDTPSVRERIGTVVNPSKRSSILYKQVASFNPERLFDWLLPRTGWAFTPAFQFLGCFLILCGVSIFFLNWEELRASTPNLLNIWTLLMVWPIVFSVSAYHEFSHGLTCRHFGGQVKEVGFMLIYFSPAFYCDVSDAWMFPKRRQRMLVTMAGGYSQLMLWGLCTIIWRITDSETYINHIVAVVAIFSGLQTLFNFNPLIKLDGYYMLSDYLEVPNLRSKAFSALWSWITRDSRRKTFREERAQLIYGVCAVIFSSTLLVLVYSRIYSWATDNWQTAGLVGFAMFSTITLRRTATESMSGLKALISHVAVKRVRNGLIVLVALLISIFVPWQLKISATLKILAQSEFTAHAETAGNLTEVLVREGTRVRKGDLLARTEDYAKKAQVEQISGELQEQRSTLKRLMAGPLKEEIEQKESLIAAKKVELENVRRNQQERGRLEEIVSQRKTRLKILEIDVDSQRQLFQKGLIAEIKLREAENAVEVQKHDIAEAEATIKAFEEKADLTADLLIKQLDSLEKDLKLLKLGNRRELIEGAQAQVDRLTSLLASLRLEISKSEIRAPIDGIVATPFPERMIGRRLTAGDDLIRLVDTSGLEAEMLVPEKDSEEVKEGSIIWMKVRGLPNPDFEGRVDAIAPVARLVDGQQMIVVRSKLSKENENLKPDMTGVAVIYAGKRPIIDIFTYRMRRWFKTEFLPLLP